MKSKSKTTADSKQVSVETIRLEETKFYLLGTTPLIMNRLAEKARQELLLPSLRRNQADLQQTLKHDPVAEYRSSVYKSGHADAVTAIHMPSGAFKKALAQAAIDIPGTATKAGIGRLTSVPTTTIDIWGVPKIFTTIVRQAGINKTPDVRTRALFPEWACVVRFQYVASAIQIADLSNLILAAGFIVGVGDYRPEKGAGSYGQFSWVNEDNADYQRIVSEQGTAEQLEALANPQPADAETEELLAWFESTMRKRGQVTDSDLDDVDVASLVAAKPKGKGNGKRRSAAAS